MLSLAERLPRDRFEVEFVVLSGSGAYDGQKGVRTIKGRLLVAPFVPVGALFAMRDRHRM